VDYAPPHVASALSAALSHEPAKRPTALQLAAALRDQPAPSPSAPAERALRVVERGRRYVLPTGEEVDLGRRRAPRAVLAYLVDAHLEGTGRAVDPDELIGAGWPGERMSFESARGRLYVAVYTLRKMGFDELIERVDDGYRLLAKLTVHAPANA
jgi:hypothetical protein